MEQSRNIMSYNEIQQVEQDKPGSIHFNKLTNRGTGESSYVSG